MAIHLGPSVLHYVIGRRIDIRQAVQGQETSSRLGFQLFATATIRGPADPAGYPTMFVVDSIVPDSGTALPVTINLSAARRLTFSGVLHPDGEFHRSTPSDSAVAQALAQVLGTFRDFYPHFPAGGLKLGAMWTDTISRTDAVGAFEKLTVTAINNSHASALEDRGGIHSVRIDIGSQVTMAGSGTQGGQPLTLAGTGSRQSVEFVAVDGRYLGGETLDSTRLTITLPLQGLAVPVQQVSHATVKVLP
ncbi:MAG: hypothetical protein AUH42_04340 [Gemmatimonadetes bacterium 13_1_40CM_70_11]|nr:MAG: hypothetical protein AUH42_04340 [Gemmatimonadetes bacterium 13_1_40CM_70_11]